ncbi:MAG: hypothetical protein ACFCU2_12235 [Acidimicrobiia bacterium]
MRWAARASKFSVVAGIVIAAVGCADHGSGSEGDDDSLRATAGIEYLSHDVTLEFKSGVLEFGSDPWARHEVSVAIATDDYIQYLTLFDLYVIDGKTIAPATKAVSTEFALSDENTGISFAIDVQPLSPGIHNFEMSIPVRLEPQPRNAGSVEPDEIVMEIEFVYDVFLETSPLVTYCARADQLLTEGSIEFSPDLIIEAGADALGADQISRLESARGRFQATLDEQATIDPNEFFDLIEEFCDVNYPERWAITLN